MVCLQIKKLRYVHIRTCTYIRTYVHILACCLCVNQLTANTFAQDFVRSSLYPVLVISYEMLVRSFQVLKKVPFDLIVCDEGHRLKNSSIKTTSVSNGLVPLSMLVRTCYLLWDLYICLFVNILLLRILLLYEHNLCY